MAKGKNTNQTGKKPFYKRWWFIAIIVIVLIGSFGGTGETEAPEEPTETTSTATVPTTEETTVTTTEPVVTEEEELSFKHGELLDVTINSIDNIAVIKAKIQPSYSTRATIVQNYLNVCDLIQNHGFDQYGEVQYWAIADMSDGSEQKVISFTVNADLIKIIVEDSNFVANNLGDHEIDLWLHPSLQEN